MTPISRAKRVVPRMFSPAPPLPLRGQRVRARRPGSPSGSTAGRKQDAPPEGLHVNTETSKQHKCSWKADTLAPVINTCVRQTEETVPDRTSRKLSADRVSSALPHVTTGVNDDVTLEEEPRNSLFRLSAACTNGLLALVRVERLARCPRPQH
ncbi:hypothetical protein EYF80_044332 [Liparis tanakae]|uniref:Uncharacterized protein n=1 Tax=Liparis tanakae TaxID=230148 RepID=A0A4Z2FXK5_9TELE|nr:hypothetical protein EYF80_044332 [Liparis tanakae]